MLEMIFLLYFEVVIRQTWPVLQNAQYIKLIHADVGR